MFTMNRMVQILVMILTVFLCTQRAIAQSVNTKYGKVLITPNAQKWYDSVLKENIEADVAVILHFVHIPTEEERYYLYNQGVLIGDYVGGNSYDGILNVNRESRATAPALLLGVESVNNYWKAEPAIYNALKLVGKQPLNLLVSVYREVNSASIEKYINSIGGKVEHIGIESVGIFHVSIPAISFVKLRDYYAIKRLSLVQQPIALNYVSKTASKSNIANLPVMYGGYGLKGNGITVGIGDNSAASYHIDLKDRIKNFNSQPYANHGVHINGIAGGAGIVNTKGEGVAPEASFINHLFSGIWEQTGLFHDQYNMTITNNSYAAVIRDCDYAGTYNNYSEAIDKLSLQYRDVLHVFAAGNDGLMTCGSYPAGYGTVVGAYQTAKNCLVVTSTDKRYINAKDGGRGPIKDGRLKPELTAVGVDVFSATRVDSYFVSGGTSMASPGVAGGLALLSERYRQIKGNVNAPADVLKALVLNTATDLGNPGPDYTFGFGFMNLSRALHVLNNSQYFSGLVSNGGQQTYTINVPPGNAQLKVMLLWFDDPASVASTRQLVNDLDIEVVTPASTIHKPLILDPTPANILNNAVEGVDRLNNTEQVIINNPQSGTYTIVVKGYNIPSASRDFILTYDFVEEGLKLTYPTTGAQAAAGDSLRIYWDASSGNNTQRIEYSTDAGSSWQQIANNVPASQRYYTWYVPDNISSGKCMLRVVGNVTNEQSSTGLFAINPVPVVSLDAIQCPEYININWQAIPNAAGYEVMRKIGASMKVVDTVTSTNYVYAGLSPDSMYYVAVRPILDGLSGYRSLAIKRTPRDGDCTGSISDGDISVRRIISPTSGRLLTSTALTSTEILEVELRNLDDMPVTSFRVGYRLNGGVWKSKDINTTLPANSITGVKVDTLDLSATGQYTIELAVQNLSATDVVNNNDSIQTVIRHLNNTPVNIAGGVNETFEAWPIIETSIPIFGVSPDERWDYYNVNDTCRMRSFVKSDITISGSRSVSLDASVYSNNNHRNELSGTYNLATYNASTDEIRYEFDYTLHGYSPEQDSNALYVRGDDSKNWVKVYSYDIKLAGTGKSGNSGSLSLTDALLGSSQNFSSSTQVMFMQNDVSLISMKNFGRGVTIDNLKMYTVQNDIQLLQVVSPIVAECGLTGQQPLTIKLRNGVNQQLNNIQLYYKLDNNAIVNESLNSLSGKQTINYTFSNKLDLSGSGRHVLNIWVSVAGDSYTKNDSILNYEFYNQPLIKKYPYLEDFEADNGAWYAGGINNSWAYGVIASPKINKAASGTKAWKTSLTGIYNDYEQSYLYSPCFDLSSLQYPTFRFKRAVDIEYCGGAFCDGAFMEYSTDGITWQKLGKWDDGNNWYNDTLYNVWSIENSVQWQASSILLPKKETTLRLRYQFLSDMGSEREGLAVDDVEIFDDLPILIENNLLNVVPNPTKDGKLTIDWTAHGGTVMELTVFNIVGKKVYEAEATAKEGRNYTTLQTPNFQPGVYLYHIMIGDKKYTRKIVYL